MSDLIARLEQATEGSRELSDEVLLALGCVCDSDCVGEPLWTTAIGEIVYGDDPARSVDDALKLMKEQGHDDCCLWWITDPPRATAYFGKKEKTGAAATPALALCIAILKAEQANE